jgi:hypothetical protein
VALADEYNGDSTPDFFFRDKSAVWIVGGDWIQPQPQRQDNGSAPVERYPVEQDGTWGYINAEGDVVIEPQFEDAEPFSGGYARVVIDGQPAVIDSTGAVTLRPDVLDLRSLSEGLDAASPPDSDLWGYVDTTGTFAVEPQYDRAFDFSNGRAVVEKNDSFGYIDRTGTFVIEPQFDGARRSGNDRAPVLTGGFVDGSWGYISRSGGMVIEPQYEEALPFSENRAAVNVSDGMSDEYGFTNPSGDMVIKPEYDAARSFSNGLAPVQGGSTRNGGTLIDPARR